MVRTQTGMYLYEALHFTCGGRGGYKNLNKNNTIMVVVKTKYKLL